MCCGATETIGEVAEGGGEVGGEEEVERSSEGCISKGASSLVVAGEGERGKEGKVGEDERELLREGSGLSSSGPDSSSSLRMGSLGRSVLHTEWKVCITSFMLSKSAKKYCVSKVAIVTALGKANTKLGSILTIISSGILSFSYL